MGWLIYNYKELYIFDLESFCVECFTPFFFNFYSEKLRKVPKKHSEALFSQSEKPGKILPLPQKRYPNKT